MRILDVDQVTPAEAARQSDHFIAAETIHAAFASPTGMIAFSDRRILITQREHLLEEKVETSSYPYREIRHFSITEASGGGRSTIRIWLGTEPQPLHLRARSSANLHALQALLADKLA